MAKVASNIDTANDCCPYRMQVAMTAELQRLRIHVAGQPENSTAQINVSCIGSRCMVFLKTGTNPETGAPIGACGLVTGTAESAGVRRNLEALNAKVDAVIFALTNATEKRRDKGGEFIDHFTAQLRPLFEPEPDDAPAVPDKPKLAAVPGDET